MVVLSVDHFTKIWKVPPQGVYSLPFICLGMWPVSFVHIFLDSTSYNSILWIKVRPRFWHNNIIKLLTNGIKPHGNNLKYVVPISFQTHKKPELASNSFTAMKMNQKIGRRYVGILGFTLILIFQGLGTLQESVWVSSISVHLSLFYSNLIF